MIVHWSLGKCAFFFFFLKKMANLMNSEKVWREKTTKGRGRQWRKSLSSLLPCSANFSLIPTVPSPLKCGIQSLPLTSKILAVCQWPAFNFSVHLLNTICTYFSLLSKLGAISPFSLDQSFPKPWPGPQNLLPNMFWAPGKQIGHFVRRISPLVQYKPYSPPRKKAVNDPLRLPEKWYIISMLSKH